VILRFINVKPLAALWRIGRIDPGGPLLSGKRMQVLVENGDLREGKLPVRWVVVATVDVIGFEYSTEGPIEGLPIAGGIAQGGAIPS
jgi:hypothetical protein